MIILDDLERLVEYVRLGPRFSNAVLQALMVLIKKIPPTEGRKLMIVATTSQRNAMEELGLMDVVIFISFLYIAFQRRVGHSYSFRSC